MRQLLVAVKSLELRAMSGVGIFQDHEVLRHLNNEFSKWNPACDVDYFLRQVRHLREQWVLSRVDKVKEPAEKWRYIVATFQKQIEEERDSTQVPEHPEVTEGRTPSPEEIEAHAQRRAEAMVKVAAINRKIAIINAAKDRESGEDNFKVDQGLLQNETYEDLKERMKTAVLSKVRSVFCQ